jgi:hypothetical protein
VARGRARQEELSEEALDGRDWYCQQAPAHAKVYVTKAH